LALLTGFLGSGKTTFIRALLAREALRDTLVIVNEFGEIGIDHHLIADVHDDVILLRGGCLCCQVRQDLARTLRDMHLRWLAGRVPGFSRVVIEASGAADPAAVIGTLLRNPLVRDPFALCSVTTCVDAEHGQAQLDRHPVSRRQVAVADRILLTKPDRASSAGLADLRSRLERLNGLAAMDISRFGDAPAARLFAPVQAEPPGAAPPGAPPPGASSPRSSFQADHGDDIRALTLVADGALAWPAVQVFIGRLLDTAGDRVLRLKGILDLAHMRQPVVVQAVHHSFYPLATLAAWPAGPPRSTLVLLHTGSLPDGLQDGFAGCRAP
jgi:G3E family GTPase